MNRSAVRLIGSLAIASIAASIVYVVFAARQVVDVRQPRAGVAMGEIAAGHSIGQTFVSHRPYLDRIDLLLATYARTNPGQLVVQIYSTGVGARRVIQTFRVAASALVDNQYHSFTFPPIAGSAGQGYEVRLSSTNARPGEGVTAWAAPADVYHEGSAVVDGRPVPGRDLAFVTFGRLTVFDWLGELARGIGRDRGAVALAVLILFLPGLALLGALGRSLELDVISSLAIAPGLSIGVIALTYLWANVFGIPIVSVSIWLLLVLCAPLAVLGLRHARAVETREIVGVLGLFGMAAATELAIVNRVGVPFWGDSYQHTVIVQLLLDHRGLFTDWRPYADLQSFTYHYGFHAYAAVFASLSGVSATEAVIFTAQLLGAAAALASVALARGFGVRSFGSVITLVTVAFLSPLPTYFVNWGRDTELAGLIVLGSVGALWLLAFPSRQVSARPAIPVLALLAISVAGLGLTHYREALLWIVFLVAGFIVALGISLLHRWKGANPSAVPSRGSPVDSFISRIAVTTLVGLGALLCAAPWLPRLWEFAANAQQVTAIPASWSVVYDAFGDLGFFVSWPLLTLACLEVILRFIRHQADVFHLALWVGGSFAFANLPLLGWPAGAIVNNFSVEIGLFLPVAVAIGLFADDLAVSFELCLEKLEKKRVVDSRGLSFKSDGSTPTSSVRSLVGPLARTAGFSETIGGGPSRRAPRRLLRHVTDILRRRPLKFGNTWAYALVLGVVVGLASAGSTHQLSLLDRGQALVLGADRPALHWIRANTPSGSRFLVNSFLGMGGTVAVGSDAGWWLPILANRPTTLPPVNYTDERMRATQRALVRQVAAFPPDQWGTAAGIHLLRRVGVRYVFLGAAGGRLSPADFDGRAAFHLVFASGPTRVYQVIDERNK